jgi:hypothetical protein
MHLRRNGTREGIKEREGLEAFNQPPPQSPGHVRAALGMPSQGHGSEFAGPVHDSGKKYF